MKCRFWFCYSQYIFGYSDKSFEDLVVHYDQWLSKLRKLRKKSGKMRGIDRSFPLAYLRLKVWLYPLWYILFNHSLALSLMLALCPFTYLCLGMLFACSIPAQVIHNLYLYQPFCSFRTNISKGFISIYLSIWLSPHISDHLYMLKACLGSIYTKNIKHGQNGWFVKKQTRL